PERPERGPIDGDTHLLLALGPMGKHGGPGGPGITLRILDQAMRLFALPTKAFLRIDSRPAPCRTNWPVSRGGALGVTSSALCCVPYAPSPVGDVRSWTQRGTRC